MNLLVLITGLVVVFLFSFFSTSYIRKYSLSRSLIDVPNDRSSHTVPTPRGGGLSISISVLLCVGLLYFAGWLKTEITMALGIGGLLVAVIGWIDDHKHIPALWRTVSYAIAAGWAVFCLGGLQSIKLGTYELMLGQFGSVLAVLGVVWLTNLYKFMEGTDGMAATQAICVGLLAGILFWLEGQHGVAIVCFVISASSCGFLYWNWPPARIFMGDAGSCLLGFAFGVLSIIGEKGGTITIAIWFILLAVFIGDATLTLLMRIMKGEKWYQAHKSHAYQRLAQLGMSHKNLALSLLLINIMILWPMATMAFVWGEYSYHIAAASILLISVLWGAIQVHYYRHHSSCSQIK